MHPEQWETFGPNEYRLIRVTCDCGEAVEVYPGMSPCPAECGRWITLLTMTGLSKSNLKVYCGVPRPARKGGVREPKRRKLEESPRERRNLPMEELPERYSLEEAEKILNATAQCRLYRGPLQGSLGSGLRGGLRKLGPSGLPGTSWI